MAVETNVPGLHLSLLPIKLSKFFALLDSRGLVGIDEVVEQAVDTTGIGCHATLQYVVGIGLITQQLGDFATQVDETLANGEVVLAIVMGTHGVACHIHLLAQIPLCGVRHKRQVGRRVEGKEPALLAVAIGILDMSFLPRQGCCLTGGIGEPVKLSLVSDFECVGLVFLQQVLRELQREHRGLFRQLTQTFLTGFVEQGTATHKSFVAVFEKHLLLGSQLTMMQVYLTDAFKEFRIQPHVIGVLRQDGLYLLRQSIHLVVGLGTEQVEEHRRHPRQQVVVALVLFGIDDGIVEGRTLGVVDGLLYLFVITTDTLHEGFLEVFQSDAVEGHGVVWCAVRFKEGIHYCFSGIRRTLVRFNLAVFSSISLSVF